ncbi:aspartate dehydrogenase [Gymnodinialimonas sp. 2305UL16-5]|uniref:aspartate dehydrogenase n=1 Tax=Gymnodinialimonas mytili TaxID=3126503 RepID=UPI0030B21213
MKIGIIGSGAIATYVADQVAQDPVAKLTGFVTRTDRPGGVTRLADLGEVDLLVDCAGHPGLSAHGPEALTAGIDVVTLSLGALADDALFNTLTKAAERGGAKLHLASGAIGALDVLRAAQVGGLTHVTYTGRKPPAGWRGSPAEHSLDLDHLTTAALHFDGTAREAALRYPKNANVAAAVALAGTGFDATQTQLIADPEAIGNSHEIRAEGAFGTCHFTLTGTSLPDNPKSSALAAMSAVAALRQAARPWGFL